MNKKYFIGIGMILMISMLSIGAVFSYNGPNQASDDCPCANDDGTCPGYQNGAGNCNGTCARDGTCDPDNCPNNNGGNQVGRGARNCGGSCRR